jgi:uncharacterized surface protein with fasciclin (FAS1) repeats
MNKTDPNRYNRPAIILGLAMALGPLTALSFGTKFADEETWDRARAGLENVEVERTLDPYGDGDSTPAYARDRSIDDVLAGAAIFGTFREALAAVGDQGNLNGGVYTVLVPTDSAFDGIPAERMQALMDDPAALSRFVAKHIIPGRYTATDLMQMREARTLGGDMISVGASSATGGNLAAGGAEVVKSNIFAKNGVVHVLERPIL